MKLPTVERLGQERQEATPAAWNVEPLDRAVIGGRASTLRVEDGVAQPRE